MGIEQYCFNFLSDASTFLANSNVGGPDGRRADFRVRCCFRAFATTPWLGRIAPEQSLCWRGWIAEQQQSRGIAAGPFEMPRPTRVVRSGPISYPMPAVTPPPESRQSRLSKRPPTGQKVQWVSCRPDGYPSFLQYTVGDWGLAEAEINTALRVRFTRNSGRHFQGGPVSGVVF